MTTASSPVWFITGCSTGLGNQLAKTVIARGFRAVVTARDKSTLDELAASDADRVLALELDVTKQGQITAAVQAARARFGRIDVLVNNAGYGYLTSVEEGVEEDIRKQFDANVFGLFAMTRAVLPAMREQRKGHVINITSVAGMIGFAASGYYSASKHAVEGFSDSLLAECGPLGIHVTCVEPGPFRTDWAGRSMIQTASHIDDYAVSAATRMKTAKSNSGKQPGDPARAAEAMIRLTEVESPPRHLVLGAFGFENVTNKLKGRLAEIEAWKSTSLGADFPKE